MGGPNPGIVGNIKVTAVDGDKVTFHIPRYCAINADGSPYFVEGYWMTVDAIKQSPVEADTVIGTYVGTIKADYSLPGDVVEITISVKRPIAPLLDVGSLWSAQFINQYPVG